MKIGSLFDGSGGFPLAGSLCGIEPVWAAEIEPYPIAVTRSRFPNMKHLGSVTDINGAEVEPVDVITFGSPCQDLSVAGKRAGLKHTENGDEETTRSGLFMEAVRIIKEMRNATNGKYPRYAIWENVPGAFSSNKGLDFRIVLEELIRIAEPTAVMPEVPKAGWSYSDVYSGDGWSLAYRVLDAQYWGVPQRRRRIYLVADFGGQRAGKILFERKGLRGYFAQSGEEGQAVAGDAENRSGAADCERKCYGISSYESNSMKSANPHSGVYEADTSRTLDLNGGNPACNQGGIAVVETVPYTLKIRGGVDVDSAGKSAGKGALIQNNLSATLGVSQDQYLFQPVSIENHPADSRVNIDDSGKVQTLTSRMGTGGGNVPMVMETQPVYCIEGNGSRPSHQGDGYSESDTMYTLNTIERHAVAYWDGGQIAGTLTANNAGGNQRMPDKENFNCVITEDCAYAMTTGSYMQVTKEVSPTLMARDFKDPNCVAVRYIVRRLTPTECARLQGFPDEWGHIDEKSDFADDEYRFWLNARNLHAAINGKATKEYTKEQMLTWYNKLHTDSSEYKMWGNGIALPCALYVMQGIAEVPNEN